ncbi:MAG: response regulator [Anaerolineae bacterium]|nr:response regulator [Anaerolineae bacterium]
MTSPPKITNQAFDQLVKDCLAHLYDYSFLRDNLLVQLLVPDLSGASQVQVFRQIITETIERLRPDTGTTFDSKQGRIYNLLFLRYIDQQQPQDVILQLALSERQFYRDHPKALQILSALLWERYSGEDISTRQSVQPDISVESEVQRIHSQGENASTELKALLEGAVVATQSLASQHDVSITLNLSSENFIMGVYSGLLRQTVLLILSQLILHFFDGGQIEITPEVSKRTCQIIFALNGKLQNLDALHAALTQQKSLQTLIGTLGGMLNIEDVGQGEFRVVLNIPLNQRSVLLIDDNPGMIDLFRRFLTGKPYQVLVAEDGEQAVKTARQSSPDVIILDVMLPGKDGWEVLQNLKNHPTTRHIPVLICSVLDAFDLALSLGADACLKKPPSQADLLEALARWQA